jgi:polysaccharide export outer membrane protein
MICFQGSLPNSESNKNYSPVLRTDDLVSIIVGGLEMDAIKPFNLPVTNLNSNIGGYTQGTPPLPGYLIDAEGNVDFPVIGKIKLAGLTRSAAMDYIKEQLKPYLNNPTIQLRILNYKVTVLGEVRNPGTFTIPNERITLLEALGIAGDLNITAMRKNVMVIREVDGKRTETRIDLTSKDVFSSPVYYLQQNDLVYVEPNRAKINSAVLNPANVSLLLSAVSLFVTIAILIKK